MGDRAHHRPVVFGVDREACRDQIVRAIRIGAEYAGDEADEHTGAFRVAQAVEPAHRLHRERQPPRIGLVAIAIDESQYLIRRDEVGRALRRGGDGGVRNENREDRGENGKTNAHVPPPGHHQGNRPVRRFHVARWAGFRRPPQSCRKSWGQVFGQRHPRQCPASATKR
jgi:hypothetical protein